MEMRRLNISNRDTYGRGGCACASHHPPNPGLTLQLHASAAGRESEWGFVPTPRLGFRGVFPRGMREGGMEGERERAARGARETHI